MRDLVGRASIKWVERLAAAEQCHVLHRSVRCTGLAIAHCVICKNPTCLRHAFVDGSGEAVCFACLRPLVGSAAPQNGKRPPDPKPPAPDADEVAAARKLLKVKASASWDEVRTAYRKLTARWHPDKVRDAPGKEKAEAKLKALNHAYEVLKREYQQ